MANEEQSDTSVIRHGLQYGELPEAVKSALLSRGLGDPPTQVLRRFTPNDGIGAYPCLVLDSKDYSLALNAPNEEIEFPGDTQLKCFSKWQDAF